MEGKKKKEKEEEEMEEEEEEVKSQGEKMEIKEGTVKIGK